MTPEEPLLPEEWRAAWRLEPPPDPAEVMRKVKARTRLHTFRVTVDVLVAIAGLGVLWMLARARLHPADMPFALAYATAVAALGVFSLLNARGTWRPLRDTPQHYAALQLLRVERQILGQRMGYWFVLVSLLLYTPWIWMRTEPTATRAFSLLFMAGWIGVFVAILTRSLRRTRAEVVQWRQAVEQLGV
jgi:hypothetical protein